MKNQSIYWLVGICTGCELEKYYILTMGKFSGGELILKFQEKEKYNSPLDRECQGSGRAWELLNRQYCQGHFCKIQPDISSVLLCDSFYSY